MKIYMKLAFTLLMLLLNIAMFLLYLHFKGIDLPKEQLMKQRIVVRMKSTEVRNEFFNATRSAFRINGVTYVTIK